MKKIAFFCARNWGTLGTSGTYNFIAILKQYYEIRIFSPVEKKDTCVSSSFSLPLIPIDNSAFLEQKNSIQANALIAFDPDLVYIFNSPIWPDVAKKIKKLVPRAKILLDIKTPFLLGGQKRLNVQDKGIKNQYLVNKIITLSIDSVNTWIPECNREIITYPLGINISLFKDSYASKEHNKKFIFVGSLHPARKLEKMIRGFASYALKCKNKSILDIYGSGVEFDKLNAIIDMLGCSSFITLKGKMNQKDLFEIMGSYDAGIAWVPKEKYNTSPSLKVLEYMAASIPVIATDTDAHTSLTKEGYKILFCNDTAESLSEKLGSLEYNILKDEDIQNNKRIVSNRDYKYIINKYIRPVIQDMIEVHSKESILFNEKKINSTKKQLSIIFFVKSLAGGRGGAEKISLNTAKEMSKRGHLIYIMYEIKNDRIRPLYSFDDTIILLPFRDITHVISLIVDIDPSVLMLFFFNRYVPVHMIPVLAKQNIPVCFQECTNPSRLLTTNWRNNRIPFHTALWERDILSAHATRIRLVMPSYKNSFPPMIQSQIRAFPNPCDIQSCNSTPEHQAEEKKYIFIVNPFKPSKNFSVLLYSFHQIAFDFPDWNIMTIGRIPPRFQEEYADKIYNLIEKLKLKDRIELHKPENDILPWYAKAHIHIITSLSEGCPTVVLEAMSMGIPSIGFADCPGVNELIRHQENGLLVNSENREKSLTAALQQLMRDDKLRNRLGCQAFEDAKDFSPQKIYDQWEEMFFEASEYKNDKDRLLREQIKISPEAAIHARRMIYKLL